MRGQLSERAAGVFEIFAKAAGTDVKGLQDLMKEGKVGSDIVLKAGVMMGEWADKQGTLASDSGIVYSQMYNFNMNVNVFPLAAYQKIYQDFFRWSQWENADPTSYNFDWYQGSGNLFGGTIDTSLPSSSDYWKRDNLFSLRYCNWNKDMFMGVLPNSQFDATVNIEEAL